MTKPDNDPHSVRRTRNAAATREAILQAAYAAFAKSGYDGAGLREIASTAGVSAMMVNRYFGSKEGLFAAVVDQAMNTPSVMRPDAINAVAPAQAIANALVDHTGAQQPALDGMRIILSSASNPRAAEIIREQMERRHHAWLANSIKAPDASERAAMALALIAGFQFMRQMIGLEALASADPELLKKQLAAQLALLLEVEAN